MTMYGRCKNCWWYKLTKNPHYTITSSGLKEFPGEGICYMQSTGIGIEGTENYVYTSEDSYCPDYYNRKKEKIKLEDWIKSCYNKNKHQ